MDRSLKYYRHYLTLYESFLTGMRFYLHVVSFYTVQLSLQPAKYIAINLNIVRVIVLENYPYTIYSLCCTQGSETNAFFYWRQKDK